MSFKSKVITISTIIGLIVLAIILNYISNEFFSLRYWNPIERIYVGDVLVKAEVVENKEEIELGLAGRKSLSEGRGMLFEMPANDYQRFWMRGMQFPIDIIWVENGRVIGCEKRVSPDDERIFTSPGRVSFVLEVPADFCDKYQVRVNDLVEVR